MVKTFLLDFGRVSILSCFDVNFMESWHEAWLQGAQVVIYPSTYGSGFSLRAYAALYQYYVVPVGWGDITDITGQVMRNITQEWEGAFTAVIDTDRVMLHENFNGRVSSLLWAHKGKVVKETLPEYCYFYGHCAEQADILGQSAYILLSRTEEGVRKNVSVRSLLARYNLRPYWDYKVGAQRALSMQRMYALPDVRPYPYRYAWQVSTVLGRRSANSSSETPLAETDPTIRNASQANADPREASALSTAAMKQDAAQLQRQLTQNSSIMPWQRFGMLAVPSTPPVLTAYTPTNIALAKPLTHDSVVSADTLPRTDISSAPSALRSTKPKLAAVSGTGGLWQMSPAPRRSDEPASQATQNLVLSAATRPSTVYRTLACALAGCLHPHSPVAAKKDAPNEAGKKQARAGKSDAETKPRWRSHTFRYLSSIGYADSIPWLMLLGLVILLISVLNCLFRSKSLTRTLPGWLYNACTWMVAKACGADRPLRPEPARVSAPVANAPQSQADLTATHDAHERKRKRKHKHRKDVDVAVAEGGGVRTVAERAAREAQHAAARHEAAPCAPD
jgi:hypothetical protein